MSEVEEERKFQFLRDGDAEPSELDWNKGIESARKAISEAMNAKNIAFLLGAGCSSLMKDKKELGIATMAPLAKEFCGETIEARAAGFYSDPPTAGAVPAPWRLTKDELDYLDALGVDLAKDYSRNLERLMEVLFAQRFVLRQSENPDLHPYRAVLDGIIKNVQDFLWTRVTQGAFATEGDTTVREQSVLITAGYAFGDEHLNNIIYQALTIPTFRLVIFAAPDTEGEIAKLRALRDPRIWIIGGNGPSDGTRAHYFDMIVEHFMPQRPSDRIDDAVRKVLSELAPKRDDETKDGEA